MPKLSIIVPVYNVEKYIERCIDSILSQSYIDFEVILIDDGSPDQCGAIIDAYARKDHRVVSIHQKNKGVSTARNAGLRVAKGEYIGFIDPDDWIEPDMYSILLSKMETNHCDIASCSWIESDENGKEKSYFPDLPSKVMSREEYMGHLFDMPPTISGSVWSKVVRKTIISCNFPENYSICEDNFFIAQCCVNCKTAVYVNQPLYHFFQRQESATRKEPEKMALGLAVRREIIAIASGVNQDCGNKAEYVFIDQCVYFCNKLRDDNVYKELARKEFLTYIKRNKRNVLINKNIPFKQKVYFLLKYIELSSEKGK